MAAPQSSISGDPNVELFKSVYGKMHDLVPEDQIIAKDIPWADDGKVGSKFIEDVVLGDEVGITLGGSGQEAFEINPAIAGAVKQTEVIPYVTILPSVLPFATVSRSAGGGEQAFFQATKFITRNNLKSHNDFQEIFRLYGQSSGMLGYTSYYSGTFRGQPFTNGTGTINGVTFTNGVNIAQKAILFEPGTFASGIFVGKKGVRVVQVNSSGVVVASGKLVTVNSINTYVTVDFVPVVATAASDNSNTPVSGSIRIAFDRMQDSQEMIGQDKILRSSTTLFGIDQTKFELFKGNFVNIGGKKLSLGALQEVIANAVNGGGLEGDVTCYVNPRTWGTLGTTEAGLRVYDQSYKPTQAQNGFMDLEFYSQTGKLTIKAHRKVKEGDTFVNLLSTWKRSGSAQVGFRVPGMAQGEGDLIRPLENQAGYQFKSYADEYLFCWAPAQNIMITGINDEAAA